MTMSARLSTARNAVLEGVIQRIEADWEHFAVSPSDILDAGESVLACGCYSGIYRKNGKHVKAQGAHGYTLRNEKVVRFQQYTDTAQFWRVVTS
ncbi:MAG: hypothetical protein ABIN37_07420 [Burkholderiaceae bacterium]